MQTRRPSRMQAFTLAETITVLSIILIVASIAFVLSRPTREEAYETACMSNLRQLYAGNAIYAQSTDAESLYPELHGLSYLSTPQALALAFPDQRILWCPGAPEVYKRRLGISYNSALWFSPVNEDGAVSDDRKRVIDREKMQGPGTHIVECTAHDEFYYALQEKDVDNLVATPFRIFLNLDGSVVARKTSSIRDFPISGTTK